VREGLATSFEGLPDVHYGSAEHFEDLESQTGISKWYLTGTGREGKKVEVRGCYFYTFRECKVIRKDSYWKIVERWYAARWVIEIARFLVVQARAFGNIGIRCGGVACSEKGANLDTCAGEISIIWCAVTVSQPNGSLNS
jgi:hypothetical protein